MSSNFVRSLRNSFIVLLILIPVFLLPQITQIAEAVDEKTGHNDKIRESVIAGTWYPASPAELRREVETLLSKVPEVTFPGRLISLIAPHAGYTFSGQVAAHAYKLLERQRFSTAVIIGPSHHARFSGVSVYDRGGFRTPLGLVPLDYELISALKKCEPRIRYLPEAFSREHSVEIQLPFLQVLMPQVKLVPLVMGEQDFAVSRWLSEAIAESIKDKSVLVIASSDLSHFKSYDEAKLLDQVVLDKVRSLDPKGLSDSLAQGKCSACGGGPIITAIMTAQKLGANNARILSSANSGDITGDRSRVVGYMAAALGVSQGQNTGLNSDPQSTLLDQGISNEERTLLHIISKKTIEARCRGEKPPKFDIASRTLKESRGAFVTLHKNGQLRGCIGRIIGSEPLAVTVAEMSEAAAFRDPRFKPVNIEELKELEIEISVLTPLAKIKNIEEIQVGVHGLYIRQNGRSGLLLPQVATEYGWDRKAFLENTCLKAILPRDAWKAKDTEIFVFSAEVF